MQQFWWLEMQLNSLGELGTLEIDRVYFEHDGPRLFRAVRPEDNQIVLGVCVDESDSSLTYLYWELSPPEVNDLETGRTYLRDSVLESMRAYTVVENYDDGTLDDIVVTPIIGSSVPAGFLPDPDAALPDLFGPELRKAEDVPLKVVGAPTRYNLAQSDRTLALPGFNLEEMEQAAEREHHLYTAIEVGSSSRKLSGGASVSLGGLAKIAASLQDLVYAIGNDNEGFARTGETVRGALDLSVVTARAASFVLVTRTPEQGALFDGDVGTRSLRTLTWILRSAGRGEIVAELDHRSFAVRRRVRELLVAVNDAQSSITIHVTDGNRTTFGRVSRERVSEALVDIAEVPPKIEQIALSPVMLTALNLTRRSFEVLDEDRAQRYSGALDQAVLGQVDGLAVSNSIARYSVTIRIESDYASDGERPPRRYRLLSIVAL